MTSLPSKPGSQWSLAHLLLLSKFVRARKVEPTVPSASADRWAAALGERKDDAIRRFASHGLLVSCTLAERLSYRFSSAVLRGMLRERGLKLSGRKDAMAQRLCAADHQGMETTLAGVEILECSESGRQLADEFFDLKTRLASTAFELLRVGRSDAAVREVCDFQDALGFPIEPFFPDRPNPSDVRDALSAKPRILKSFTADALEKLQLAAAMAFLGLGSKWFPDDMDTNSRLSNEIAVNMLVSSVQNARNMGNWRGYVKHVKILGANLNNSCEICLRLKDKMWPIDQVPELPHADCISECGCRCVYVAEQVQNGTLP